MGNTFTTSETNTNETNNSDGKRKDPHQGNPKKTVTKSGLKIPTVSHSQKITTAKPKKYAKTQTVSYSQKIPTVKPMQSTKTKHNIVLKRGEHILCTDTRYSNKTKKYKAVVSQVRINDVFVIFEGYQKSQGDWIPKDEWTTRITIKKAAKPHVQPLIKCMENNNSKVSKSQNKNITQQTMKKMPKKMPKKMTKSEALQEIEYIIYNSTLECLQDKCISDQAPIQYISPQELLQSLPQSLEIDRRQHVIKHHSGQWEIYNKNIHCYIGFQVISTDSDLKQLLKHLQKKKSEKYRRNIAKQNDEELEDSKINYFENYDSEQCMICGQNKTNAHPAFGRHICRVSGYFKCIYYKCNGHSFRVGICLLDPMTETPPTRYKCCHCGYVAKFIRYDLKERQKIDQSNARHRSDLCEACDMWGDCRQPFVQPSDIHDSLWDEYEVKSEWKMNQNGDGVYCSFVLQQNVYSSDKTHYKFEIKPYVKCVEVNVKTYVADMDNVIGANSADNKMVRANNLDKFSRSQKYENPPVEKVTNCYSCGEEGHFARECPSYKYSSRVEVKCYNCGGLGHYARECEDGDGFDDEYDDEYNNEHNNDYNNEYDDEHNNDEFNHGYGDEQYNVNEEQNDKFGDEQYNVNEEQNNEYDDEHYNNEYDDEQYNVNEEQNDKFGDEINCKCFHCGQTGHWAEDCPQNVRCNRCGRIGHWAEDCTEYY